jgi:hypothetical protein
VKTGIGSKFIRIVATDYGIYACNTRTVLLPVVGDTAMLVMPPERSKPVPVKTLGFW